MGINLIISYLWHNLHPTILWWGVLQWFGNISKENQDLRGNLKHTRGRELLGRSKGIEKTTCVKGPVQPDRSKGQAFCDRMCFWLLADKLLSFPPSKICKTSSTLWFTSGWGFMDSGASAFCWCVTNDRACFHRSFTLWKAREMASPTLISRCDSYWQSKRISSNSSFISHQS